MGMPLSADWPRASGGRIQAIAVNARHLVLGQVRSQVVGCRRRGAGTLMVMMAFDGLQIGLQAGIGLLRAGQIAGLQGAHEALIVGIGLAVLAKRLGGRGLRTAALQILLKGRHRALCAGQTAGLQGAADGLEILDELVDAGLIGVGGGGDAGDRAHSIRLLIIRLAIHFQLLNRTKWAELEGKFFSRTL